MALGLSRDELVRCFATGDDDARMTYDDFRRCIDGKSTGAVRVSLGLGEQLRRRLRRFLDFAREFLE